MTARTRRYEEDVIHEAGVGMNRPRVQRRIIRMRIIMTDASCSPAVASRRTKSNGNFRVQTLV
jgi:hypothetical protein